MTTTKAAAKYTAGQRVQHLATDFKVNGMPSVWYDATVSDVELQDNGLWSVGVWHDGESHIRRETVGKRGANKNLRAA